MDTLTEEIVSDRRGIKTVTVLGNIEVIYRAVSEDTQGAYSLFESIHPPGSGPPPHIHTREDESWYVLEGSFNTQIGSQSYTAAPGWFAIAPRNIPHGFTATGPGISRMLVICTPAGFEHFFDALAEVAPFDLEALRAVFDKHGLLFAEPA